ncbi:MAG: beta-mannosidase [Oscillospiraceae bacterium]|nr:beta-mannosidase [Oscillospiraceae bacterium]
MPLDSSPDPGIPSSSVSSPPVTSGPSADPVMFVDPIVLPAETAELIGSLRLRSGYIENFSDSGDMCVFTADIAQSGFYDLIFHASSIGGYKENHVLVNGENVGLAVTDSESFVDCVFPRVYMEAGENTVALLQYWGWIRLQSLTITPSEGLDPLIYDVSAKLSNPNADDSAKRLMSYLADSYGNVILAGQYSDAGLFGAESAMIHTKTGQYPAVIGLDFMDYSPSRVQRGTKSNATQLAIEAWENGAIVTFCWHWNAPAKYLVDLESEDRLWWRGFYTRAVKDFDLAAVMDGKDPEGYDLLLADIDAIAEQLAILRDAGVPVLWRPLHEASGGWFWWGAFGPEAYIKLWNLLYERLTDTHGLNNLIWLWNGQDAGWYPGDGTVDMIGEDVYPGERVYTPQTAKFMEAVAYTAPPKMVVLSESGFLPDPGLCLRDSAMWGFAAPWAGEFLTEKYIEDEMLLHFYNHERVITLDGLPDLKDYPIRDE